MGQPRTIQYCKETLVIAEVHTDQFYWKSCLSSNNLSEQCQGLQFLLSSKMLSDVWVDVASSAHAQAPADDQNLPLTAVLSWDVLNPSAKQRLS